MRKSIVALVLFSFVIGQTAFAKGTVSKSKRPPSTKTVTSSATTTDAPVVQGPEARTQTDDRIPIPQEELTVFNEEDHLFSI